VPSRGPDACIRKRVTYLSLRFAVRWHSTSHVTSRYSVVGRELPVVFVSSNAFGWNAIACKSLWVMTFASAGV
jgi:hypothetical protein